MSKKKPVHHQRPLELTIWVAVLGIFGVVAAVGSLIQGSAIGAVTGLFLAACAAGLWYWKRWAYFAVLISYGLVILIALAANPQNNLVALVLSLAIIIITVALIQPRLSWFH